MTTIHRFRYDNTDGYTAADLANLNNLFREVCAAWEIDPVDGEKSVLDAAAERAERIYDGHEG